MACKRFRRDLARYRELTPAERQALDEHLRACPRCRNALAAYARQDALFGTLSAIQPSPGWARRVQERLQTVGKRPPISRPVWAKAWALALLAILLLASSTLVVSAHALPGQPLYVLKRGQEELRLRLLPAGTPRAEYAQTLAERRREEAKRLIQKGGTAELTLEGTVEAMQGAWWRVGGVEVQVTGSVHPDPLPALGERVTLHVRIQGGHATALAITRQASSHAPAERPLTPAEMPSATPTLQGKEHTPATSPP
ncbi:MAG: zf-HC2 domain-containing protein, partial [Chloroflexi bacterium]|nr:zf-HC2 domain-containing protein [Chloroflexota bacterium]